MARRSRPTGVSYVHEHMHVADIHAHMVQEKLTPYHAEKRAKEHGPQDNESASGCEVYIDGISPPLTQLQDLNKQLIDLQSKSMTEKMAQCPV